MTTTASGRTLGETHGRNIKALELRPRSGQGTAMTVVRGRPGQMTCDVSDGGWTLVADVGTGQGGQNLGPDPGVLIRGGLGVCLVGGYQSWAAHMGITLDEVEVTIEADYDARGMYATDATIPPGYLGVRATVRIISPDPEERVREMAEHADRHSPLLYDFRTPLDVQTTFEISAPTEQAG